MSLLVELVIKFFLALMDHPDRPAKPTPKPSAWGWVALALLLTGGVVWEIRKLGGKADRTAELIEGRGGVLQRLDRLETVAMTRGGRALALAASPSPTPPGGWRKLIGPDEAYGGTVR